jgi:predicted dehydrogenase
VKENKPNSQRTRKRLFLVSSKISSVTPEEIMDNKEKAQAKDSKLTRRRFLKGTTASAAAIMVVPRHVLGGLGYTAPSDKLNLAGIGVGGMGKNNLAACEAENIVALCDVDDAYSAQAYERFPTAKKYRDYRKMLEQQKDIDAIIIATPDHTHAVIAMAAMQMGKHVYVQKPITHSVYEARKLTEAARKYKVVTQMGNQGHSGDGARMTCEWIWDGAIGPVREVHAWTNRPVWPQGVEVDRPTETPAVPPTLDWDLWIGPAQYRPYHPDYLPEKWRAWWDFGTGSLGDLGCHILDPAFWALKLKYPDSVEGNISTY